MKKTFILTTLVLAVMMACQQPIDIAETQHADTIIDTTTADTTREAPQSTTNTQYLPRRVKSALRHYNDLRHVSYNTVWYQADDDYLSKFDIHIELYIDSCIDNSYAFRKVEEELDIRLAQDLNEYWISDKCQWDLLLNRRSHIPSNVNEICHYWENSLATAGRELPPKHDTSLYNLTYPGQLMAMAHKVFENTEYVTYMVFHYWDFNGSCGCLYITNYYTINKHTGQLFTCAQAAKSYGVSGLQKRLYHQFCIEAKKRQTDSSFVKDMARYDFVNYADGCALLNEGILFYYQEGLRSGSEEQYDLIIKPTK